MRLLLWSAVGLSAVLGVGAGVYGGLEVKRELERPPTQAEKDAAAVHEVGLRWRTRTAGDIFPATVDYGTGGGKRLAKRVGIAEQASCADAMDAAASKALALGGCRAVLRATYVDSTETLLATVGVAVLPDAKAATKAWAGIASEMSTRGVRAAAIPGTVAAGFGNAARQTFSAQYHEQYLIFTTAGWADGRKRVKLDRPSLFLFADRTVSQVGAALTQRIDPCLVKEVVSC